MKKLLWGSLSLYFILTTLVFADTSAFISYMIPNEITRLNTDDHMPVGNPIVLPTTPSSMIFDNHNLYVNMAPEAGVSSIGVIDTQSNNNEINRIFPPNGILFEQSTFAFNAEDGLLYIPSQIALDLEDKSITVMQNNGTYITSLAMGRYDTRNASHVLFDKKGQRLFAAHQDDPNNIYVFSTLTYQDLDSIQIATDNEHVIDLVLSANDNYLYIVTATAPPTPKTSLHVLDLSNGSYTEVASEEIGEDFRARIDRHPEDDNCVYVVTREDSGNNAVSLAHIQLNMDNEPHLNINYFPIDWWNNNDLNFVNEIKVSPDAKELYVTVGAFISTFDEHHLSVLDLSEGSEAEMIAREDFEATRIPFDIVFAQ